MATIIAFKFQGQSDYGYSTDTAYRLDTASPSYPLDTVDLDVTAGWSIIQTDYQGNWLIQGDTHMTYSSDDGQTWASYATPTYDVEEVRDGTSVWEATTAIPAPYSMFHDGTRWVMYGKGSHALSHVYWWSTDGVTWIDKGLMNASAMQPGNAEIPDWRYIAKQDRYGRYFSTAPTYRYGYGADQSVAILSYTESSEIYDSWYGHSVFDYNISGIVGLAPAGIHDAYYYEWSNSAYLPYYTGYTQGFSTTYESHVKTDGSNIIYTGIRSGIGGTITLFSTLNWEAGDVGPWGYGGTDSNYPRGYSLQPTTTSYFQGADVVFTGNEWVAVGTYVDLPTNVRYFGYARSPDGITWTIDHVDYRTPFSMSAAQPETRNLFFDGTYVWWMGCDFNSTTDGVNLIGKYNLGTDAWTFEAEGGSFGWGNAAISYDATRNFIYSDVTQTTITISSSVDKMVHGKTLRDSMSITVGSTADLTFMNFRGTGQIDVALESSLAKYVAMPLGTLEIRIGQKNLLLTETEIIKVKGMPLGVGGRFAQLDHYVRNVYRDLPIVYMPLNDRDEAITGVPQNSETDNMQEEVF